MSIWVPHPTLTPPFRTMMIAQGQATSAGQEAPAEVAPAEVSRTTRFNFVARLTALPAVIALRDVATQSYGRAKNSSAFVAVPLQLVELGVQLVGERSLPVLDRFGPQLSYVDGLACRGLAAYTDLAQKQPWEVMIDTMAFGLSKLVSVKDYGMSKAQVVKTVAAGALHVTIHPVQSLSLCKRRAFNCSLKALEAFDAALDEHMASRAIDLPERSSSSTPNFATLFTLLDAVVFKTVACAKAQLAAWITGLRQRIGRVRFFFTVPMDPPQGPVRATVSNSYMVWRSESSAFATDPCQAPGLIVCRHHDHWDASPFAPRSRPRRTSRKSRSRTRLARLVPVARNEGPNETAEQPTERSSNKPSDESAEQPTGGSSDRLAEHESSADATTAEDAVAA
ncbi:uncharacterized protein LOC8035126 [Ixodes scapularis]|uniref:uncharacterized protein LOC8035126 n=1 Tax=Ixodes scapularis TaxID=6945 RepID=UPI001C383652|nr:uncharacterized protein LOC8035126 [Ixodes scapularis]